MNRTADARQAKSGGVFPAPMGVLQRKCACGNHTMGGECAECATRKRTLQRQVTVGASYDPAEREADGVADQVMAMSWLSVRDKAPLRIQRLAAEASNASFAAPPSVQAVIGSSGEPLKPALQHDMERRFGHDFSQVRVHTDSAAARSAQDISAVAYTTGNNIVFGAGQYRPGSSAGRKLIAHELTHVVQQAANPQSAVIQRFAGCTTTQDAVVAGDHSRARGMLSRAIAAVSSYNGTTPARVRNALSTHFHGATSSAFAAWVSLNLRFLKALTWMAGYECFTRGLFERFWACRGPRELATTFWCVPGVDIRLCPPYFRLGEIERSTTLIHEWVHKYGCNFDLGYEHEAEYSGNRTVTQLLNADSFSSFVRDVS